MSKITYVSDIDRNRMEIVYVNDIINITYSYFTSPT